MKNILKEIKKSSVSLACLSFEYRNKIIWDIWDAIVVNKDLIIKKNKIDLEKMDKNHSMHDRLLLNSSRIDSISWACYDLMKIADPLDKYEIEKVKVTKEWLKIKKTWVSLWVVACIYEARPNVTIDLSIMCIKSGNAIILRWWSAAKNTNKIIQTQNERINNWMFKDNL